MKKKWDTDIEDMLADKCEDFIWLLTVWKRNYFPEDLDELINIAEELQDALKKFYVKYDMGLF